MYRKKDVCPFLLLENSRHLSSPWEPQTRVSSLGALDFLSTCLGVDSVSHVKNKVFTQIQLFSMAWLLWFFSLPIRLCSYMNILFQKWLTGKETGTPSSLILSFSLGTVSNPYIFFLFLKLINFFIEGYLLYGILVFAVKPQQKSAIGIHISPPSWTSLPSPSPSHPSRLIQSPVWASWATRQIPVG